MIVESVTTSVKCFNCKHLTDIVVNLDYVKIRNRDVETLTLEKSEDINDNDENSQVVNDYLKDEYAEEIQQKTFSECLDEYKLRDEHFQKIRCEHCNTTIAVSIKQ